VQGRNPWTNLRLNNDPDEFRFAIVSDRTGGHRAKVFSQAVQRLNLLQPEFVLSVGDLIEGYTEEKKKIDEQWTEFDSFVGKLKMPFFYVPGNHDVANKKLQKEWENKFGRRYYHFVYRNVLFLVLDTDDPYKDTTGNISPAQIEYVKKTLEANKGARWTIVCLHRPMWTGPEIEKHGWLDVEKLLNGRSYTVFAGHIHRFQKFVRQGMNYYQLATTGGASKMRGQRYGEFDHIAWITMKKDGPLIANVMLDGVFAEDMTIGETDEPGVPTKNRKPTHPCTGTITFQGKPVSGASVVFHSYNSTSKKYSRVADAMTNSDGTFVASTYTANDGVPVGEYKVTVTWQEPRFDITGKPTPNRLPPRYASPQETPLSVRVEALKNVLDFGLEP
jgi:3',5'-cyclic AMP phosphodiesterase CpdA